MNVYIFVSPVETAFSEPMPKKLEFDNKEFNFLYEANAVAEQVWGEGKFEIEETERFWDYEADEGSYLSLGVNEKNDSKADFYGKKVAVNNVEID